jgi:hypothetical protein
MHFCKRIVYLIGSYLVLSVGFAQINDSELYANVASGGVDELREYLNAGGRPSVRIKVPHASSYIALLDLAIRSSQEDPALVLLNSGAWPENTTEFVEIAAEKGFAQVLTYVLDRDPSLVLQMRTENHPLFLAIAGGHYAAVSTLLDKMKSLGGAERDVILNEAFSVALNRFGTSSGSTIVRDLLEAGADPVTTPALAIAVSNCAPELVSMLLAAGADAARHYDLGSGPVTLPQYASRCFKDDPDVAKRIIGDLRSAGGDVCGVDLADNSVPDEARVYLRDIENCNF